VPNVFYGNNTTIFKKKSWIKHSASLPNAIVLQKRFNEVQPPKSKRNHLFKLLNRQRLAEKFLYIVAFVCPFNIGGV